MVVTQLDNESDTYRRLRAELNVAELALRDQRERVAALRRSLPADTVVADQVFVERRDGVVQDVALSALFEAPDQPLVLMHFMFGQHASLCPMCAMWADGYNAIAHHLNARLNFVVLIAGDPEHFAEIAAARGWDRLRIVSTGHATLKRDLGFETQDGSQGPGVTVLSRTRGGDLIHHYSQNAMMADGEFRGMDLLSPVWHFLDLTPDGRGDWMPVA
ncbi:MAG: DUF899 family protein [Pseudomonadota bacterium]